MSMGWMALAGVVTFWLVAVFAVWASELIVDIVPEIKREMRTRRIERELRRFN